VKMATVETAVWRFRWAGFLLGLASAGSLAAGLTLGGVGQGLVTIVADLFAGGSAAGAIACFLFSATTAGSRAAALALASARPHALVIAAWSGRAMSIALRTSSRESVSPVVILVFDEQTVELWSRKRATFSIKTVRSVSPEFHARPAPVVAALPVATPLPGVVLTFDGPGAEEEWSFIPLSKPSRLAPRGRDALVDEINAHRSA